MAERTAEQVRAALKNQLIVFDPTFEDPNEQFRQIIGGALGSRRMTRDEVAQAAGIPVEQLIRLEPDLDLGSNERNDLYQQYITPGRGTGFFASLLGGVGGVVGGLTNTVADPVANALGVHPDAIKAAAALAGMYYGGGGAFFDATTGAAVPEAAAVELIAPELAANTGAGLIDASLGQAYSNLGVGPTLPAAGAGVVTQPIPTAQLPAFVEPGMAAANMLAADAAGLAVPTNAFVPSATTGAIPSYTAGLTSSGLSNFIDPFNPPLSSYTSPFAPPTAGVGGVAFSPEALAAYDASVGLTAAPTAAATGAGAGAAGAGAAGAGAAATGTGVANALSPEALAAYDASVGLTAGTGAGAAGAGAAGAGAAGAGAAGAGAGANALGGYGGAGDVLDPVTGVIIPGTDAAAAGLSTGAFDTLAKFAKDYGVPLASLISGITGSQAAKSAADVQAQSAREARELAKQIYEKQVSLQEPFRTAGITAQNQLLTLLGLPGGTQGAEYGKYARPFGMQDFQADPGYAFRLSEGMKALEASRAAKGGLLSGATGKALSRYGQDLASQEYGNAFNRYQTERVNRLQPLGALMGTGQAAAAGQAGYAGQYGQTAGGLTTDIGAVRAAGDIGAARAISNALSAYGNYMGNQNLAQAIRESQYNR